MKIGIGKRETRILYSVIAFFFIIIHINMFFMFRHCGVTPMANFNIFSIAFYLFSFYLLYKYKLNEFMILSYFEVVLHMCLAVYFTGWNNGFQITLIGMNILLFFAEYIGRMLESRFVPAAPMCLFGLTCYILSYVIDTRHVAQYPLPERLSFILQIAWAVIVFSINILILEIFVLTTFHSETYLSKKAGQDELTGLFNRYTANGKLEEMIKAPNCEKNWAALIDIDDFKQINDTYGHNYGDYVLTTLADIMRDIFGPESCFRWGGEEFLIVGTACANRNQAYDKMEQLRKTVENYEFNYEGVKTHLTITAGITFYKAGLDQTQWIDKADIRLYEGKRSGKNKVVTA